MTKTRAGAMLMGLAVLAACSDGTGPEQADEVLSTLDADVAMVAAQATIDDVQDLALVGELGALLSGDHDGPPHGDRPRDGEISRTHTVTFLDGSGEEMDGFDPELTATILTVLDVSVEHDGVMWEGAMSRHREMELSGLEGEEATHVWNGAGSDEVARTRFDDEDGDRSYAMSGTATIDELIVPVPRTDASWPLSGTITRHIEVTVVNGPDGDVSFERTVTITFDGTQYATLTVDGEEFEVDLADRDGRRPRHRGRRDR